MLRHIKVKNFVHFRAVQDLSFSNGPHFFIGQNESGKICMLEALRRCMSTSKSMGMSSSHAPGEPTFVMCDFEISGRSFVRSGLIRVPPTASQIDDVYVKFVFILNEKDVLIDLLWESKTGWTVNKEKDVNEEILSRFRQLMITEDSKLNISSNLTCELLEIAKELVRNERCDVVSYDANTKCEKFLRRQIDPVVVIVYPTRAIATGQWTKSDGFEAKFRDAESSEVEKNISHKSEIMNWYFDDKKNNVKQADRERVKLYFRNVTNNNSFIFKKQEDGAIQIKDFESDQGNQLIKVPEGYFEAKHCAILLGVDQHKTICIEEAGKGMHPQMIERLRDLVLKNIDDKVVIITSHSPSMLSYWNISKIFFFRKIRNQDDEDRIEFSVKHGDEIISQREQKTSRMITNQLTSTVFFARRVMYVEGDGDLLFMTVLKQLILEDEKYASIAASLCREELETDTSKLRKFLYSLQFISMQGEKNKDKFRAVSISLGLQHFFLLDFDVITFKRRQNPENQDQDDQESDSSSEFGVVERFLKSMEVKDVTVTDVRHDVSNLEPSGIFIWHKDELPTLRKQGTLEHALISLVEKNEHLKSEFRNNKIHLQWDSTCKTKGKHKFGNDKQLTFVNVENIIKLIFDKCAVGKGLEFERLLKFLTRASNGMCNRL